MDQLFLELVGKPNLNPPKLITIVADDFSLLEDQARFLKATLAIPSVKQLPLDNLSKRLIQFGPLQCEIGDQVRKEKWAINQYEDFDDGVCARLAEDLVEVRNRSLLFFNDVSRLELSSLNHDEPIKLLKLADRLKCKQGHFVVMLYQNSLPNSSSKFLRDLEFLSDAFVVAQTTKSGYFLKMWYQMIPETKTLIPAKVCTSYYTCKIGKFYWSSDLLCFYDKKMVGKNFDPDDESSFLNKADLDIEPDEEEPIRNVIESTQPDKESTLPYTKAQNPEQSRIFYYPDKEDDIDEEDPDNDLNI